MASVKIYVHPRDFAWAGLGVAQACRRIGASVTLSPSGATHVFALSDAGAFLLADASATYGVPFASRRALESLSDRVALVDLGVPCIHGVRAENPKSIAEAFDGPVFVKKRMPVGKQSGRWVYTRWSSVSELLAAADESLWSGDYVVQDDLGESVSGFDITVAVNSNSDMVLVLGMTFVCPRHWIWNSETSDTQPSQATMGALQSAIRQLDIRGGVYNIQIAEHQGKQMVMDWNIRPGASHALHGMGEHGIFDRALAHLTGLQPPEDQPFYVRNQHYANAKHVAGAAEKLGLSVRRDWYRRSDVIKSAACDDIVLFAAGTDGDAIRQRFKNIEGLLK